MARIRMKHAYEINSYSGTNTSGLLKAGAIVGGLLYALKKLSQKKEKPISKSGTSGCSPCK